MSIKETHAHIDKLVRDQLNELPLATAPAIGWDALERTLDAPEDAHLRNALTGLAAMDAATGWQALESKLDFRTPADAQLANQLNKLKPAVAAGSWEALVTRLDRETEAAVDIIVTDGLARTTSMVSSGWAALAARLELIGWRRSTVAAWKITEGALLMSLLLLLIRFGPEAPRALGPIADLHDGFPLPMAETAPTASEAIAVLAEVTDEISNVEVVTFVANEPVLKSGRLSAPKIPLVLPTLGRFMPQPKEARTQVQGTGSINGNEPYLPVPIVAIDIRPLKNSVVLPSPMLNLAEIDNSAPAYYYANGFISPMDINQVVTPGHIAGEYDISSERRYTTGFTAGGLLDMNKGRHTLQIGVIYSRRSYSPAALNWRLQDYFTPRTPVEGYRKFVYHTIEFPFSYKFTLSENDRWRVSARTGMSLSVIAKPEIQDQEEVVASLDDFENEVIEDGFSRNNIVPNGVPRGELPPDSDHSSEHELKAAPKGWLEGGSILANSSFYLGGGITVERIMNPRWSIYLSPSIGRVIYLRDGDGIGPYRDRINLGSLRMGARYRFGGKK